MSSPIKPPTGSAPGLSGVQGPTDIKPAGLGEAGSVRAAAAPAEPTATAGVESPSASWLLQLEAGEVTRQQAIEGLVQQALEAHGGARLQPAQRVELEQVLRAALLDDPVLGRLIGDR